jgi:DTW domain-containing protein YfiP
LQSVLQNNKKTGKLRSVMKNDEIPSCDCKKGRFCICPQLKTVSNKLFVLILQHPQEPKQTLGSAILVKKTLKNCHLAVGLSWPNLQKIAPSRLKPSEYACLYLGPKKTDLEDKPYTLISRTQPCRVKALIVLDGTWSQAKTLWWRNPWLLKTQRLILHPQKPSLYGKLRKEPRVECLSTLESTAMGLSCLGEKKEVTQTLLQHFEMLIQAHQKN